MRETSQAKTVNQLVIETAWPFVISTAILLATMIAGMAFMSAVRAYVEAESLWSKGQKQAYISLIHYLDSRSESDYEDYLKAIAVPLGDNKARLVLSKPEPDIDAALNGFIEGGNRPADALQMSNLFKYFKNTALMEEPIMIWTVADGEILKLHVLGGLIHQKVQDRGLSKEDKARYFEELKAINQAVTPLEEAFSKSISEITHRAYSLILILLVGMAVLLVSIGLVLVRHSAILRVASSRALQRESEKNAAFLRNASDGIHILDKQGNIIEASDSFCSMLGYERSEIIGMNVAQWDAHFVDPSELQQALQIQFKTPLRSQFETRHRRKDGTIFDVEVSGYPLEFDGKLVLFNSSRDISDRKQIQIHLLESEKLYRNLFNDNTVAMFRSRLESGEILNVNEKFMTTLGYSRDELIGSSATRLWAYPDERGEFVRILKIAGRVENFNYHLLHRDGRILNGITSAQYYPEDGILIGSLIDVTEMKKAEREGRIASVAFEAQEGMIITDASMAVLKVNKAFTRITGYANEEIVGKNPRILKSGRHDNKFYEEMWRSINDTGSWEGEIWNRRKNGEIYPEYQTISAVRDSSGKIVNYIGTRIDITQRKQAEEQIQLLAFYDPLTGLPNRRLFRDRLVQDMRRVMRNGSSLALLLIDLDRFKEINDSLGHDKGDVLLVEAARRIRNHIREADTLARLGGDEFVIVLSDYEDSSNIDRVVLSVLQEIITPFDLGEGSFGNVSCSIGITLYPQDGSSMDELLKNADQAMYAAKAAGRNGFSYFTQKMQQAVQEKAIISNELRFAISRNELEVYYQPIVDLQTGNIEKAEALLRWESQTLGKVGPNVFIPLAEEFGLIHDFGDFVFTHVLADIGDWRRRLGRNVQISINRSPIEFDRERFNWIEMLEAHELPGNAVTMEITEGLLLKESEQVKQKLIACRNAGVEVSIDDFGTGYSALSYLKKFDIDYLKVDQTFVKHMTVSESDRVLVEAIILLAHKLGIKAIAEGVETVEQRDMLVSFGCDYAQGYLYAKPIPANEFEALL